MLIRPKAITTSRDCLLLASTGIWRGAIVWSAKYHHLPITGSYWYER